MDGGVVDGMDSGGFQLLCNSISHGHHIIRRICGAVIEAGVVLAADARFKCLCGVGVHDEHLWFVADLNGKRRRKLTFRLKCCVGEGSLVLHLSGRGQREKLSPEYGP